MEKRNQEEEGRNPVTEQEPSNRIANQQVRGFYKFL